MIDGATDTLVESSLRVGYGPWGVDYNPLTRKVYVANQNGGGATVVDAVTYSVVTTINPGHPASGVAVNSSTNRVYITQENSRYVWVVDGNTDTVIETVDIGVWRPVLAIVNPNTNKIYVGNNSNSDLVAIDGDTLSITTIPVHVGQMALNLIRVESNSDQRI